MWPDLFSFILILSLIRGIRSRNSDITWIHPSKDDSFGSGDKILCKWTAENAVVSPSVQLCMISDDSAIEERGNDGEDTNSDMDCGESVWPSVEQSGGQYTMSLWVHSQYFRSIICAHE